MNDASSDQKSIRQAQGFLNIFNDFEFSFLSLVYNKVFEKTNILFEVLQKKSFDIAYCITQINIVTEMFETARIEVHARTLFNSALKKATIQGRRAASEEETFQTYKQLYHEILDAIVM